MFHPVIPAAPIVGFPIPIHWGNGDAAVCPPPGAHYPITLAAGYTFPNPTLTASGQTNVAFVTAVNCVQPIYAVPATSSHHIQSQYQVAPLPQTEPVDLSLPAVKAVDQLFLNPGQNISASSQTTSITLNHVSQGAANISPVSQIVTICHNSMQHPPVSQVLFISQASIAQVALTSSGSECPAHENRSHSNTTSTSQSQALTGLPPSPRPPSIEFGGPIVFSNSPEDSNKLFKNTHKDVFISDVSVNKEVVIDMEALNISHIVNSQQIEKQNTNVDDVIIHSTQSPAVHVTSSPVNTSAGSSSAVASIPCKSQEPSANVAEKNTSSSGVDKLQQAPTPPAKMWSSLFGSKGSRTLAPSAAVMSSPAETATAALPNALLTDEVKSVKYWQDQERTAEVRQTFVATDKFVPVTVQNDPLAQKILGKCVLLGTSHIKSLCTRQSRHE